MQQKLKKSVSFVLCVHIRRKGYCVLCRRTTDNKLSKKPIYEDKLVFLNWVPSTGFHFLSGKEGFEGFEGFSEVEIIDPRTIC